MRHAQELALALVQEEGVADALADTEAEPLSVPEAQPEGEALAQLEPVGVRLREGDGDPENEGDADNELEGLPVGHADWLALTVSGAVIVPLPHGVGLPLALNEGVGQGHAEGVLDREPLWVGDADIEPEGVGVPLPDANVVGEALTVWVSDTLAEVEGEAETDAVAHCDGEEVTLPQREGVGDAVGHAEGVLQGEGDADTVPHWVSEGVWHALTLALLLSDTVSVVERLIDGVAQCDAEEHAVAVEVPDLLPEGHPDGEGDKEGDAERVGLVDMVLVLHPE